MLTSLFLRWRRYVFVNDRKLGSHWNCRGLAMKFKRLNMLVLVFLASVGGANAVVDQHLHSLVLQPNRWLICTKK